MSLRLCSKKTVIRRRSLRSLLFGRWIGCTARPPPALAQPENYAAAWLRQTGCFVFLPRSIGCKRCKHHRPRSLSSPISPPTLYCFFAILYRTRFTISFCANIPQCHSSWFHQHKTLSKAHKKLRFLLAPRKNNTTPPLPLANLLPLFVRRLILRTATLHLVAKLLFCQLQQSNCSLRFTN